MPRRPCKKQRARQAKIRKVITSDYYSL
jgi:hypothetical protein